ncbi:hypothetical protein BCM0075_4544 [Bacillus cereus]|nr:hypothetical protein BCM0075_4544 [Bacillus cereus]
MARGKFDLSVAEDRLLWVHSGGMCAKCKRVLILDDVNAKVNIGERAHIIGKSNGKKGGPRREFAADYGITEENIDSLMNLMLMCSPCHHTIDTNVIAYPPNDLFEMKKAHEEWVSARLSKNKKAIVVIHKRKNSMPIDSVLLADEIDCLLLDSVTFQQEFIDFTEQGWEQAKKENEEFFKKAVQSKQEFEGTYLYLFPLSPIPLLIHLGKLISATVPVIVYQYDRDMQQWCLKDPDRKETPVGNQVKVMYSEAESQSLAVTVQVSGTIEKEIVHDAVGTSFHHLDVSIEDPHLTAVLYQQDVEAIKRTFRRELYKLNDIHRYKDIHLFYYGPAGLAIELGRCINDSMLPDMHLYEYSNRNGNKYERVFSI